MTSVDMRGMDSANVMALLVLLLKTAVLKAGGVVTAGDTEVTRAERGFDLRIDGRRDSLLRISVVPAREEGNTKIILPPDNPLVVWNGSQIGT